MYSKLALGRILSMEKTMKRMICSICGWIYDPAKGVADQDVPPGTAWDQAPPCFTCPDCGAEKSQFKPVE